MELAITVYLINFIAFISGYLDLSNGRYSATRATFVTRQTTNRPTREYIPLLYTCAYTHGCCVQPGTKRFAKVGVKNVQYVDSSKYLATTDWT